MNAVKSKPDEAIKALNRDGEGLRHRYYNLECWPIALCGRVDSRAVRDLIPSVSNAGLCPDCLALSEYR